MIDTLCDGDGKLNIAYEGKGGNHRIQQLTLSASHNDFCPEILKRCDFPFPSLMEFQRLMTIH